MTNLQIAIEKALALLKPHVRQIKKKKKVKGQMVDIVVGEVKTVPAVIGPLDRRTIEMLVDAAVKLQALQRRKAECAYVAPCLQCIHQACGSHKDNALLAPITDTLTPIDIMLAYAETVP